MLELARRASEHPSATGGTLAFHLCTTETDVDTAIAALT
jgi:hypothetical protein